MNKAFRKPSKSRKLTERDIEVGYTFVVRLRLRMLESLYDQERNPLAVWDAHREARHAGLPIPEWVAAYFDDVAEQLVEKLTQSAPDRTNEVIAEALKLRKYGGGRSFFTKYRDSRRQLDAVIRVVMLKHEDHGEGDPPEWDRYFAQVADEERKDEITIRRWFERFASLVRTL